MIGTRQSPPNGSRMRLALRGAGVLAALAAITCAWGQQPTGAPEPVVIGLYNWIHTTGDAERAFGFYRDVFGIELAGSPFAGGAAPERIRSVAEAGSDQLVWDLTDTQGSRFRTVFMRASNTPFGLELSEFFDIAREIRPANPWDPGSSKLIFAVRDLDSTVAKLTAAGAPAVTLGGVPLATSGARSLLVRDPDGYLVQVDQASPAAIAAAGSPGDVIGTSIGITVGDLAASLEFYRDLLGLTLGETRIASDAELRLNGLEGGELTQTQATIPGIGAVVQFFVFRPTARAPKAQPFRWRIQDVGAPQFQLAVTGLDVLLERTKRSGYRFVSLGAQPIQRPFGRFVFVADPDGVLVEYVEPAARQ